MKNLSDLSVEKLIAAISEIRQILYGQEHEDGSWTYSVEKDWCGADVCEVAASVLDRLGLVPETEDDGKVMLPVWLKEDAEDSIDVPTQSLRYDLAIDGPALRAQRKRLLELANTLHRGQSVQLAPVDDVLLDGLVNLTDEIADQAMDRYGIDCLLADASANTPLS